LCGVRGEGGAAAGDVPSEDGVSGEMNVKMNLKTRRACI
jgi:hypothetical protein